MNEKVKQAVEKIRELDLYDLHSEDFDNILGALKNMEELIKSKDEYIAKLCNDRAELKEQLKDLQEFARIVATKGVDSLQAKSCKDDYDYNCWLDIGEYTILSKREFNLVKKVVERYGKKED